MFVAAPYIAEFYNDLSLTAIIRVISLTIVISGVKGIQQSYVSRNMLFKRFFFATLGGTIFSAFLGIAMAYAGCGVWAIVAQQLSNTAIDTLILWITVKWRPKKMFSWERLRGLLSYGWKLLVSSLLDKDITSLEFVENIFRLMNWNRECRYKVLGRVANSDQGLCMLFDLEEAIMFTPKPQEYTDPLTGEMKKKQMKFFPDAYKNRIGKSYNDYIADHQMNMFEDFIGYQGSAVLDEPEREAGTTSIPIPQREESENIPLPDLPGQLENVQQSGNEIAKRGMPT